MRSLGSLIGLLFAFYLSLSTYASSGTFPEHAESPLQQAPAPDWVLTAGIDTHSRFVADTVLFDTQIKVDDDSYTLFRRHAMRLGPGQFRKDIPPFSLTVNPDKEQLTLHSVILWRNGVPHDVTDSLKLKVSQAETPSAQQAIRSVSGQITEAEPGDILDWSASWKVTSPDWPGQFYHEFYTDWAVSSRHDRTRIIVPEHKPLSVSLRGSAPAPQLIQKDGAIEYRWERTEVSPTPYVHASPVDSFVYGSVSVSNNQSWQDVAAWGAERYITTDDYPDAFATLLEKQRTRPLSERATWAIRYVQNEIPYDHNRQGLSTHIARSPRETLKEQRGDCKDKALLLASILRSLNIDAVVALTDIDEGASLPQRAPSAFAFDHAIVKITVHGSIYYIDPTKTLQGGLFPDITAPDFTYALPLIHGAALEKINTSTAAEPQVDIVESYDFRGEPEDGVTLAITTTRRGAAADHFRLNLRNESEETLAARYASWYSNLYTSVYPTNELQVLDDRDGNVITVVEHYLLPPAQQATWQLGALPLSAEAAALDVLDFIEADRPYPLSLEGAQSITHTIEMMGLSAVLTPFEALHYDSPSLSVRRTAERRGDRFVITHRIDPKGSLIPVDEFAAIAHYLKDYNQALSFSASVEKKPAQHADPRPSQTTPPAWLP